MRNAAIVYARAKGEDWRKVDFAAKARAVVKDSLFHAAINAYIARRVLEVIGEDEPDVIVDVRPNGNRITKGNPRNALRAEQRQRIAVIKKESQQ
jgi:hypothetical protein